MRALSALFIIPIMVSISFAIGIPGSGGSDFDTAKFDKFLEEFEQLKGKIENLNVELSEIKEKITELGSSYDVEDLASNIVKLEELKEKLAEEDIAKLKQYAEELQALPEQYEAMIGDITSAFEEVPGLISELSTGIAENPMSAGNLKELKEKLEEAKTKLDELKTGIEANIVGTKELLENLGMVVE